MLWKTAGSMFAIDAGTNDLPAYVFGERMRSR